MPGTERLYTAVSVVVLLTAVWEVFRSRTVVAFGSLAAFHVPSPARNFVASEGYPDSFDAEIAAAAAMSAFTIDPARFSFE